MPDWSDFLPLLDSSMGRRGISTYDAFLHRRLCPAGHPRSVLGSFVGSGHAGVEDVVAALRRSVPKDAAPCGKCGATLPPDARWEAYWGAYLPLARQDVLVHVASDGPVTVALRPPDGAPRVVSGQEPALRELPVASALRALEQRASVSATPPTRDEVEKAVADALQAWPDYAPAFLVLGRLRAHHGDRAGAGEAYERAVALAPEDAEGHFRLADVLDETGEEERALRHYDEALRLDPGHVDARSQKGVVLVRLGRVDEGVASYRETLRLHPHHAATAFNLALNLHRRDDVDGMMEAVAQVRPSDVAGTRIGEALTQLCVERGVEATRLGHWQDADRLFMLGGGFDARNGSWPFNRAVCLGNVGALHEAAAKARAALRLDPAHAKARGLLADLEPRLRQGVPERLLGMRRPHTLRYVDSRGRDALMLNYVVKVESTTRLQETEVARLSLDRDKDYLKLLVAKGHNARLRLQEPSRGVLGRLLGRSEPRPTGEEGRPVVFLLAEEPEPEFLALARAGSFITLDGKTVPSAPVPVFLSIGDHEKPLTDGKPGPAFPLPRYHPLDAPGAAPERFYPQDAAEYD